MSYAAYAAQLYIMLRYKKKQIIKRRNCQAAPPYTIT